MTAEIDSIIEMVLEDQTPIENIKIQFSKSEAEVIAIMPKHLKRNNFKL